MKYFIIAGEASGDLHGSYLIKAIKQKDKQAEFRYWGGDMMQAESEGLLTHYRETTIMGFWEVILKLRVIFRHLATCKSQILAFQPDVVICIDYPGFNLRIAEFCKKHTIRVVYYIAPKVWAWKEKRAIKLEKYVDDLLLIFPFEIAYFKKWKVKAHYIGNPLADEIRRFKPTDDFKSKHNLDSRPILAILPGSRKQEISRMLPVMLEACKPYSEYLVIVAGAPGIDPDFYQNFNFENTKLITNQTYEILWHAELALVCSGTATLETALFNIPQVCAYAANPISYFIAKRLVTIPFISLVNLCLNKEVIPELIQERMTLVNIRHSIDSIKKSGGSRNKMLADYKELHQLLGIDNAAEKAASIIVK